MTESQLDQLKRESSQSFIEENLLEDPSALILKHSKNDELPIKHLVEQIQAKQKAKKKLPSFYRKKGIVYPPLLSMEQCSSEQTARYKASIYQSESITDLTGGFGIDLFYFAQRYKNAVYVEKQKNLSLIASHNFKTFNCSNITVHQAFAEEYLASEEIRTDVYYLDPARRDSNNNKVFLIEDCTPNLKLIIPEILKRKKVILIKLAPMLDIQLALKSLPHVAEVHVVSLNNECKELLFLIKPEVVNEPLIKTINLTSIHDFNFEFSLSSETIKPTYGMPETYLYEPNASIMKAGAFNTLATKFKVKKLHVNTHLYTSTAYIHDFPGRTFKIKAISVINKKKLKKLIARQKANITVRNFPESVASIRKKTGITEGGHIYLFATTLLDESPVAIICNKD